MLNDTEKLLVNISSMNSQKAVSANFTTCLHNISHALELMVLVRKNITI